MLEIRLIPDENPPFPSSLEIYYFALRYFENAISLEQFYQIII